MWDFLTEGIDFRKELGIRVPQNPFSAEGPGDRQPYNYKV